MMTSTSTVLARAAARARCPSAANLLPSGSRGMAMRVREELEELPSNFSVDAIKPPPLSYEGDEDTEVERADPMAYVRNPVTSAHTIDLVKGSASALDSAAFGPKGSVAHGLLGSINPAKASTIPLEYLALLRPAAEGAAALREITAKGKGTILVYGASQPAGLAVTQLATAAGNAVVAVLDGQHSGNDEMVDVVKGLTAEPGTAVSQEYAIFKANFRDLVEKTVAGDDFTSFDLTNNQYNFLSDFKANLLDYVESYPSDLPAAVDAEQLKFVGKEKDRANFKTNMAAYLGQFQPGADPIDSSQLESNFTTNQYEIFKKKFGVQTTAVVSGGDGVTNTDYFAPAEIVRNMCSSPESPTEPASEGDYPFEFSIKKAPSATTPTLKGGPVVGAVIEVTPDLSAACEALAAEKTLRGKAEALQFLTEPQKTAYAAASSVISVANSAGGTIRTVGGSLPGLTEIQKPGDADVEVAVDAMAIGDDGESSLNYFIQVYRAGDFPVYEDYAVFRAKEPLSGPRQIVVTK